MDSVHATSHGMQNIAATVWFRNVTIDRLCLPGGARMGTNRWTIVLCGGLTVSQRDTSEPLVRAARTADSSGKELPV